MDRLLVPAKGTFVSGELEIKRSRFITWISRADDEEAARELITMARAEYPDARHHCSAYLHEVAGANRVERSSDDGEPSGTAGRPMLDVLAGSGLTDISAVVVRYFGGVKLGTGGLVRAYSDAVSHLLPQVPVHVRQRRDLRSVEAPAADAGRIESELRSRGFTITDTVWGTAVTYVVAVDPDGGAELLDGTLQSLTHGSLLSADAGSTWVESPV
ncbi:IMPACT family protein [Corynebacterium sputi]|uniref:IMPACT family protein n=1 Tax=Corynebacterium sputi TaxID=489915 RepID=UPI0004004F6F|nr:YigZ family protein [Corynebacterium sputi]